MSQNWACKKKIGIYIFMLMGRSPEIVEVQYIYVNISSATLQQQEKLEMLF